MDNGNGKKVVVIVGEVFSERAALRNSLRTHMNGEGYRLVEVGNTGMTFDDIKAEGGSAVVFKLSRMDERIALSKVRSVRQKIESGQCDRDCKFLFLTPHFEDPEIRKEAEAMGAQALHLSAGPQDILAALKTLLQ